MRHACDLELTCASALLASTSKQRKRLAGFDWRGSSVDSEERMLQILVRLLVPATVQPLTNSLALQTANNADARSQRCTTHQGSSSNIDRIT